MLSHKQKYKLIVAIGLVPTEMCLTNLILNPGTGQNLIGKDVLNTKRLEAVKTENKPQLKCVKNDIMAIVCTVSLCMKISKALFRVVFGTRLSLAVSVLLGTSFTDKFVHGLFPENRKWFHTNPNFSNFTFE